MSRPSSAGGGKSGGGGNKQSQATTSSGLAPCGSGGSSSSGSSAGNSTSSPLHSGSQQQQQQQQQQQLQGQQHQQQQHHQQQQQQQGHELTALFECPVCFDYVLPPILQCQSGHLVCNSCRQKLSCCPTCRGPLSPSIRNLAMEKVASTVAFPCKYAPSGCALALHHSEKPEHEEQCEFRPYPCPCPGASCKWQGPLESVMPHLATSHKSITTLQGEDIVFLATDIDLPGAVDWVMMQSCFGHHFLLVLEKQERYEGHQQFFAAVLLVGSRKQAEGFAYRLELNGNRRRLSWEAVPRSIHEGVSSAILNSDCLVFDAAVAHLFADGGNLGINVTISMC